MDNLQSLREKGITHLIHDISEYVNRTGFECSPSLFKIQQFCDSYWKENVTLSSARNFVLDMYFLNLVDFTNEEDKLAFVLKYNSEQFTKDFKEWAGDYYNR